MSQYSYGPAVNPYQPTQVNPAYAHKRPCGFVEAIARFYQRYAQMKGTASRSEYWYAALYLCIVNILFYILMALTSDSSMITTTNDPGDMSFSYDPTGVALVFFLLLLVFNVANIVPTITLGVRRLHDTGRSGGWLWIYFVPVAGPIILLVFFCIDSKPELWRPEWFR